jgi:epoxyqueuosine reductase
VNKMKKSLLLEKIRNLADSLGMDAIGFADASEFSGYPLKDSKRRDPKLSLPGAKTIIVAGIYIGGITLAKWADPWYGRASRLFLSGFFLDVVKPLKPIADLIKKEGYQAIVCEEGANLPLKLAAIRAGLGWQGKHSLLISKKYGTFLALGGIITDAELECNTQEEPDRCKNCDKCQQTCPLNALSQPYILNREQCMSHALSNEGLSEKVKAVMENRVIDCEICQQACPWNKKHIKEPLATNFTKSFKKITRDWESFFYLPDLANLSEKKYKEKLDHLVIDIPFSLFRRNVLIALEKTKINKDKE